MTTPCMRALVSLTVATFTLGLGACGRTSSRSGMDGPSPVAGHPLTIRFDNDSREYVHVYLIRDPREWRLGRVEPGAVAALPIPDALLDGDSRFVQLAVIKGERLTLRAALDPRATFTVLQPTSALLAQQWTFAYGELTSMKRR
jgi:hypothetical protein